jgi:RNA polymerase sigma factor (sigma-70 family)
MMSSDPAPAPRPRGTQSFTYTEDTLTQLEGGKKTDADEPPGYDGLKGLIATMVRRRNAELYRAWRRAAERDAEYLRERMASVHTWMDPEAQWIERECDELYAKTLASLPPQCRAAFVAVREDGLSYAEAAKELGISGKMVGKHISHAQRVFRLALREYGITPPPEKRAKRDRIAFTSAESRAKDAPAASPPAHGEATGAVQGS